MPKRKNLNGLPHNLTKSYFGTLRYHGHGYMADWLLNAARALHVNTVTLDIIACTIDPIQMEKLPLLYHLKDLNSILAKELIQNGFTTDFIVEAKIKVKIPDKSIYSKTLYCCPELIDKEGRLYSPGRLIETAYEKNFNPFEENTLTTSLLFKVKKVLGFHTKRK